MFLFGSEWEEETASFTLSKSVTRLKFAISPKLHYFTIMAFIVPPFRASFTMNIFWMWLIVMINEDKIRYDDAISEALWCLVVLLGKWLLIPSLISCSLCKFTPFNDVSEMFFLLWLIVIERWDVLYFLTVSIWPFETINNEPFASMDKHSEHSICGSNFAKLFDRIQLASIHCGFRCNETNKRLTLLVASN